MTRRAAAGFARLLPLLLISAAVIIVLGAALLAACGGSSGGSSPQPTATVTVTAGPSQTPSGPSSAVTVRLPRADDACGCTSCAARSSAWPSAA